MVLRSTFFKDKDCKVNWIFFTQMIIDKYKNSISAVPFKKFKSIRDIYTHTYSHICAFLYIYLPTYLKVLEIGCSKENTKPQ